MSETALPVSFATFWRKPFICGKMLTCAEPSSLPPAMTPPYISCFFEAEDAAHRLQRRPPFLIGHFHTLTVRPLRCQVTENRRAASLQGHDDRRSIHRQHHVHSGHARITARVGRKVFVERDRVGVAESASQVGLQTPPARREIGSYSVAVLSLEDSDEIVDFPKSAPWIFAMISP